MRCSVVGATGYSGSELAKILLGHPYISVHSLTTRQEKPESLRRYIPEIPKNLDVKLEVFDFDRVAENSDVIFLALPHTASAAMAAKLLKLGKIVIDLSADFRLKQPLEYKKWYGLKHPAPRLLKDAVYGLPEMYREEIKNAQLIANPGCYPTSCLLALKPLLSDKLIDLANIIVDSKSGVSGAGRKLSEATQFCEANENFGAYKVNRHQHTPEIEQELSNVAGKKVKITFVPHLLPLTRGILTTVYATKKRGVSKPEIFDAFHEAYDKEPFVRVLGSGEFPSLRHVQNTNFCDIGIEVDTDMGRVIVISAIDNLVKGAAGQAVQNMNIRLGFSEDAGLTICP